MKRVLFIAYLFPPIANSGTQRSLKFVKYLDAHGWSPIVLTAAEFTGHPTDQGLLDEIPRHVRVERVPMLHEQVSSVLSSALGGGRLGHRVADGIRWRLQERRRVPDIFAWWQPTAFRRAMRIFKDTGFDAVFATGYPWSSLMLGRAIAQATGRPFIADFRDLWAGDNWSRDERPSHDVELAAEREVVESAATVICTSDLMCRSMANAHPDVDASRFVTIHNGFDADNFRGHAAAPKSGTLTIAYTGVWKDDYNPGALYHAVDWIRRSEPDALANVKVIAAGFKPGEARRRGLARYIEEKGILPHRDAIALMLDADLLYVCHEDEQRQWAVPGKLYEYLASGTPVLAHTHADGEAARIIRKVGGAKVVTCDDPGNLYHALLEACRWKTARVPDRDAAALASFERRALTAKLAGVLDAASSRAPAPVAEPRAPFVPSAIPDLRAR